MKPIRILHIGQDEKFIKAANYLFEKAFPGSNRFIILKPSANPPNRYIDDSFNYEVEINSADTINRLLDMCRESDVVIMHGINKLKGEIFLQSDEKQKFIGFVYGAELLNESIAGDDFLGEKTRKLERKLQRKTPVDIIKDVYRSIRYRKVWKKYEDVDMKKVFYNIPAYGVVSESSNDTWVDLGVMHPDHKRIIFTYYPLEFIVKDPEMRADGPDILLGNSASATNNHLEAIDILENLNLNGRKVITPLSYGNRTYAREIKSYGKKHLAGHFEAVTKFLPLTDYNKLISGCGIVIMNHYRSQAMGNIMASLYLGAKVFLNDTSAYKIFKDLGCHIYLINEDLVEDAENSLDLLDPQQVKENRALLESAYSENVLIQGLRQSIDR